MTLFLFIYFTSYFFSISAPQARPINAAMENFDVSMDTFFILNLFINDNIYSCTRLYTRIDYHESNKKDLLLNQMKDGVIAIA